MAVLLKSTFCYFYLSVEKINLLLSLSPLIESDAKCFPDCKITALPKQPSPMCICVCGCKLTGHIARLKIKEKQKQRFDILAWSHACKSRWAFDLREKFGREI